MASDPWVTASQVKGRPAGATLSDADAGMVAAVASGILDELTAHRYGVTTRTVRPEGCGRGCSGGWATGVVGWGLPLDLAAGLGPWPLPGPAGGMPGGCGECDRWSAGGIYLDGPVVWDSTHTVDVTVDGVALDPGAWSIVGERLLIRTDGGRFPSSQDLRVGADKPGTCQVTYTRGELPPQAGIQAAISLAIEYARLFKLDGISGECALPQRLQTISRQGVTATVADSLQIIKDGGTGVTDVDMFWRAVNPRGLRSGGSIMTPGCEWEDSSVVAGSQGAFT